MALRIFVSPGAEPARADIDTLRNPARRALGSPADPRYGKHIPGTIGQRHQKAEMLTSRLAKPGDVLTSCLFEAAC
jgi:hypothetical protein